MKIDSERREGGNRIALAQGRSGGGRKVTQVSLRENSTGL
jgi:hypothetical protein